MRRRRRLNDKQKPSNPSNENKNTHQRIQNEIRQTDFKRDEKHVNNPRTNNNDQKQASFPASFSCWSFGLCARSLGTPTPVRACTYLRSSERSDPAWSSGAIGGVGLPTDVCSHAKETRTSGLRIGPRCCVCASTREAASEKKEGNP